jgi:hypothetical protein
MTQRTKYDKEKRNLRMTKELESQSYVNRDCQNFHLFIIKLYGKWEYGGRKQECYQSSVRKYLFHFQETTREGKERTFMHTIHVTRAKSNQTNALYQM